MHGNGILTRDYNSESIDEYGAKWKYITTMKIADNIKFVEKNDPISANDGNSIGDDGYPTTYPWYASQSGEYNGISYYIGKPLNSDSEYDAYIKAIIKTQGQKESQRIVTDNGMPYDKIDLEFEYGTTSFIISDTISITSDSGSYSKILRVKEINHKFEDSWTTNIVMVEDLDTIDGFDSTEIKL